MSEWFKARLSWGRSIGKLSDAEAGRFVKALWRFAASYEEESMPGKEGILLDIAIDALLCDQEERSRISALRSEAGKKGGKPKANANKQSNCLQMQTNESKTKQLMQIRNKNKESSSVGFFDDDDDALRIAEEHGEIFDAAERAGFADTDGERAKLIDLYAQHGREALLSALDDCLEHKAKSLAYLRKVLENKTKALEAPSTKFAANEWL